MISNPLPSRPQTTRESRLEGILKALIKRIKEEKEDVGIMGLIVEAAEEELGNE
jgi:hypothetical protein